MLRFLYKHEVSTTYIPEVLVKMRTGGTSRPGMYTMKSVIENYRAWKVNGLPYPVTVLQKPFAKISQFFHGRSGAHE
jgi:glycosyltransferase